LSFWVLATSSCNMEFKKNGKFITSLCFSVASSLRWRGLTTSYLPSHVIYICITHASSLHGSLRAVGLSPFPFLSSSSPGSVKGSTTSLSVMYLPVHSMPSFGRPITSTIISLVIKICMSQITENPLCNFWKNATVIFMSYPCNLLKYSIHPR
jgi:hypothetical protein